MGFSLRNEVEVSKSGRFYSWQEPALSKSGRFYLWQEPASSKFGRFDSWQEPASSKSGRFYLWQEPASSKFGRFHSWQEPVLSKSGRVDSGNRHAVTPINLLMLVMVLCFFVFKHTLHRIMSVRRYQWKLFDKILQFFYYKYS
jgi:hypothetical protein